MPQDLTGDPRYPAHLTVGSMSAGDTVSDPAGHALAMTGLGSTSVNPLPDRLDNTGLPELPGAQEPVNPQKARLGPAQTDPGHVPDPPGRFGGVTMGGGQGAGPRWTWTPSHG